VARAILICILLVAGAAALLMLARPTDDPGMRLDELARLAQRARVSWADYGEDIKAELGATPAAQWRGAPVEARLEKQAITVRFSLEPPWSGYEFGFPILLRDPEGRVVSPTAYSDGVYRFAHVGTATPLTVPWIEVRYPPNEERRIVFDAGGVWHARSGN
jgi:hypothetical protein